VHLGTITARPEITARTGAQEGRVSSSDLRHLLLPPLLVDKGFWITSGRRKGVAFLRNLCKSPANPFKSDTYYQENNRHSLEKEQEPFVTKVWCKSQK
ncbi:unnamed protein product, partial [Nesidiocoris tenuis]